MEQLEIEAGERSFEDLAKSTTGEYFLCDLHTHLLGTGSYDFWCKHVLWDHKLFPSLDNKKVSYYIWFI